MGIPIRGQSTLLVPGTSFDLSDFLTTIFVHKAECGMCQPITHVVENKICTRTSTPKCPTNLNWSKRKKLILIEISWGYMWGSTGISHVFTSSVECSKVSPGDFNIFPSEVYLTCWTTFSQNIGVQKVDGQICLIFEISQKCEYHRFGRGGITNTLTNIVT